MRSLFITALSCAAVSLLAVSAVSAMTVVPRPGAEIARVGMLCGAGLMALSWLALAAWLDVRRRRAPNWQAPQWLHRVAMGLGLFYLVGMLVLLVG